MTLIVRFPLSPKLEAIAVSNIRESLLQMTLNIYTAVDAEKEKVWN